jgi:putative colanic acid biosynthesis acetyltransferase WcaF
VRSPELISWRWRVTSELVGVRSCIGLPQQRISHLEYGLRERDGGILQADNPELTTTAPPDLWDKVRRWVWGVAWLLLYRPTTVPLHRWRVGVLRLFGAHIESGARPYPTARIWAPWNLTMERKSCLGPGVECYSVAPIVLRSGAIVSQRAVLCSAGHDPHDPAFPLVVGAIQIGAGAWVAMDAFVGPGITIGKDAVVAARAVVVRNVRDNLIVAGNPAKEVGSRYR